MIAARSRSRRTRSTARTIEPGSIVMTCLGSANRDPRQVGRRPPTTLDLRRADAREHMSFGGGFHSCLGAHLARLEGQVAIGTLVRRFPRHRARRPTTPSGTAASCCAASPSSRSPWGPFRRPEPPVSGPDAVSEDSLSYHGAVTGPASETKTRRATALPPDERRSMIVAATLPLLLEHGDRVTSRQIAEAAGIAEGTIFRVFADKDEIIVAVIEAALDPAPLEAALSRHPRRPRLRRRSLAAAVVIMQQRVIDIWQLMSSVGTRFHEMTRRPMADSDALVRMFDAHRAQHHGRADRRRAAARARSRCRRRIRCSRASRRRPTSSCSCSCTASAERGAVVLMRLLRSHLAPVPARAGAHRRAADRADRRPR